MKLHRCLALLLGFTYVLLCSSQTEPIFKFESKENPIVRYKFTSDPATLVDNDKLYIFTGHDDSDENKRPQEWLVFSTSDLKHWTEHPVPLRKSDFAWALPQDEAWSGHVVKKNDKYYMYVTIGHFGSGQRSIAVAVSDCPEGPYRDAIGKPMIASQNRIDIDPTVFIDDDGEAYIFWGEDVCYSAKLKNDMISLDGEIKKLDLVGYKFAPWIHKHDGWYYLSYGIGFPAVTGYAKSKSIVGPWKYEDVINEQAYNCFTNHHAIVEFKGKSYLIYHNGALPDGREGRRSICIDDLTYGEDGKINMIEQTPKKKAISPFEKAI